MGILQPLKFGIPHLLITECNLMLSRTSTSHFIGILGLGENSAAMGFKGAWWGSSAPHTANPLSLRHHTSSTSSSTSSIATVPFKPASGTTLLPYFGYSGVTLFMPALGSRSPSSFSRSFVTPTAISHTGCRLSTTLVTFPHIAISYPPSLSAYTLSLLQTLGVGFWWLISLGTGMTRSQDESCPLCGQLTAVSGCPRSAPSFWKHLAQMCLTVTSLPLMFLLCGATWLQVPDW